MEQYAIVLGITVLAVISPGADFAMVSRNSFIHGRQSGMLSALGIGTSCWVHIFYTIFLLAAMQKLLPNLLLYVRFAGAAYLAYVGLTTMLSGASVETVSTDVTNLNSARSFMSGFLTNALNPKTAVFVISLYTQLIGPHSSLAYALFCGATISLCHLVWFVIVSISLSQQTARTWVLRHVVVFNRIIGTILLCIAASLIFISEA